MPGVETKFATKTRGAAAFGFLNLLGFPDWELAD
jgi:hypothetical protein